ncbi:hypothetical protein IQ06DRAFT_310596 [Phaeosphaeriaceae sp. SRC1lsM3a]|nr:hypothetical protein IQ06DRAFT_310596 [Stagonospora sp. SRC1lsM3a]
MSASSSEIELELISSATTSLASSTSIQGGRSSTSALSDDAAALALQALPTSSPIRILLSSLSSSIHESQTKPTVSSFSVEAPLASSDAANVLLLATTTSSSLSSTFLATPSVSSSMSVTLSSATQLASSTSGGTSSLAPESSRSSQSSSSETVSSSGLESLSTSISQTLSIISIPTTSSDTTLTISSTSDSSSAVSIRMTTASLRASVISSCNEPSATASTCLLMLPPKCARFDDPAFLNAILTEEELLDCRTDLGPSASGIASACFIGDPLSPNTGYNSLRCLESRLLCDRCVSSLPKECTEFFSDTNIIDETRLRACQPALGLFRYDASMCFSVGRDVPTLTGVNIGACLQLNIRQCMPTILCPAVSSTASSTTSSSLSSIGPVRGASPPASENGLTGLDIATCLQPLALCRVCVDSLPDVCTAFFSYTQLVNDGILAACQAALGAAGQGQGSLCFGDPLDTRPLTGIRVGACLSSIPSCANNICSSSSAQISSSTPTPTLAISTTSTPIPQNCVPALPSVCRGSSRGLLRPVVLTVDTTTCQMALDAIRTPNAAKSLPSACVATNAQSGLVRELRIKRIYKYSNTKIAPTT